MTTDIPQIHFAPAQGARLAYQVWGEGPAMIVAIPPMAQNIEVSWESPLIRAMFDRFGTFSRYLHFDKRGTGSSDRRSQMSGIDERVDDLRAVMNHAGVHEAHLFAQSDGGPMAILFAATYPDRVQSLTFAGSGACLTPPSPEEERITRRERMVAEWGTPASRVVDWFAPSLAADQEFRTWHQRYERRAATTDSLRELLDLSAEMDVREVLPTLDVPTLVIHRTGDRIIPVALGRELAASIPGARIVEIEGDDHFSYVGGLEPWMSEIERFVTGEVRERPSGGTPRPSVRIVTLGRFAVEIDGVEVPTAAWGSKRARQLCKRLVVLRGWPVTRDELIEMLWPDESDMSRLGARLSVQLSAVKRVLGGGIIADRQTVRLDLDEVSTDLEDFYRAEDDAAIVAAFNGELLPGDLYDDWAAASRNEARTRFVAAARRLADRERTNRSYLASGALMRRLVDVDRYDEEAHQLLVEDLLNAGLPGEARRAHEEWAAAMADLDVDIVPLDRLGIS